MFMFSYVVRVFVVSCGCCSWLCSVGLLFCSRLGVCDGWFRLVS